MSESPPHEDAEWRGLLGDGPTPPPDRGFTLRVLTALPQTRRRRERLRVAVLLLAVFIAAGLIAATLLPALVQPVRMLPGLVVALAMAALAFWTVVTVAD